MRGFLTKFPKWLLFSLLGAAGASLFCLLYEPLGINDRPATSYLGLILGTAGWMGIICLGVALFIIAAQQLLLTGTLRMAGFAKPLGYAIGLGMASGASAQILYSLLLSVFGTRLGELPRFPPWMLAAAGLGLALSFAIPNLKVLPGILWGTLGGFLGVSAFIVLGFFGFDPVLARFLGTGAIGFFTGLAVSFAESFSREGFLRVIWAPNEATTVNLGARPITVGTGKEVSVRLPASSRYPALVATFRLLGGSATMQNHMSNTHHTLRDGNKLNLGPVSIEVRLFS
jgi:Ca-activated chloride channel family protein